MERFKIKVAVYLILTKGNEVLLSRRFNTGWNDGNYSLPAGHLEADETVIEALLREVGEEIGIKLKQEDVKFAHTMHRKSAYIDLYFTTKSWDGDIKNMEPNKCDDLHWFSMDSLPENIVPSVRFALQNFQKGIPFSEFQSEG